MSEPPRAPIELSSYTAIDAPQSRIAPFGPPVRNGVLTQRQKAAVIVRLLIAGGADPGLRALPDDQQREMVAEMSDLRFIDRATLAATVSEFAAELDSIGLHFPRDPAALLAALDGQLSHDVVEELMARLPDTAPATGPGPWTEIGRLETPAITALMDGETDEVCAVILSKLPPARAGEVLAALDEARADDIAAAFARTEGIGPAAVARIGLALGRQSSATPASAFAEDPVARMGDVLNAAPSATRTAMMERLEARDPEFAARLRSAIFSFESIPARIAARDVPRVLRMIDQGQLVTALAGAPDAMRPACDFLLDAVPARLAEQLREGVEERGDVSTDESESAMAAITAAIRDLEQSGELTFLSAES